MLSPSHSLSKKKDRKAKRIPTNNRLNNNEKGYHKADNLVDAVYADIAKGASRSDVLDKITKGAYECMERGLHKRTAHNYYNAALDRFAVDSDIEAEKLRKMFYGRYESLLADAIKKGDIFNARNILDSMCKIFGIEKKSPDTAIQIVNNKEGITVNFGFGNDEKSNDSVSESE